jgi:hypothetical protein
VLAFAFVDFLFWVLCFDSEKGESLGFASARNGSLSAFPSDSVSYIGVSIFSFHIISLSLFCHLS